MKRWFLFLVGFPLSIFFQNSTADAKTARLSPGLDQITSTSSIQNSDSLINILVIFENEEIQNRIEITNSSPKLTRAERIKSVSKELQNFHPRGKDKVKSFLDLNSAAEIRSFWIVPAYSAVIPVSKIYELEKIEGINLIVENAALNFDAPIESSPAPNLSTAVSPHIQMLNVPALWSQGLTGKGRLVCSFDTGVDVGHPALAAKWHGHTSNLSSSWFSMAEPAALPNDNTGHGTHTMGILVGSENADTIGVAFDAQWITAGVIDQGRPLSSTISDILAAFQWALDPDGNSNTTDDVPDVILNSWGVPKGLFAPCDATFWTAIDNVESAGIVTVFAAGNEGPSAKSMRNPADRATSPFNSFAVGAVDNNKVVGDFSSRGPSSCDTSQHKPEVVAPGVGIRSSVRGGGYGFMTGTSMAAPYIAGLVALVRQFNPDATVEQIKNAIVLSCQDLGPFGDDNAYGYGLPDASKILDFIPPPNAAIFSVSNQVVAGINQPYPGDEFYLRLTLNKENGSVNNIAGRLISLDDSEATVTSDRANFFFGGIGTSSTGIPDYEITYDDNLVHGQSVDFCLELEDGAGNIFDSLYFSLIAGLPPAGTIADQLTDRIDFSVSDFGQYGFGQNSLYNAGGEGFRIDGGPNILYDAGLIVGRNSVLLSASIRDSLGGINPSDFEVFSPLKLGIDTDGAQFMSATMRDNNSTYMIPVTIVQKSKTYSNLGDDGFIILEYWLKNHTLENLNSIYFGFATDFDMGQDGDNIQSDQSYQLAWNQNSSGQAVGIMSLENVNGFSYVTNTVDKMGFTSQQEFSFIASGNYSTLPGSSADVMTVSKSGPFNIVPGDSIKIAMAIVIGSNNSDLFENAQKAQSAYGMSTDIGDEEGLLPSEFTLHQNYPNPFNPSTTISFEIDKKQKIELTVYNMLGQEVKTLFAGELSAGKHEFEWDATGKSGQKAASGVYFYKLITESQIAARKMTLLK